MHDHARGKESERRQSWVRYPAWVTLYRMGDESFLWGELVAGPARRAACGDWEALSEPPVAIRVERVSKRQFQRGWYAPWRQFI